VQQIGPPFFRNPTNSLPAILSWDTVETPATLEVVETYQGPALTIINSSLGGACFNANQCTTEDAGYRWTDLVGYDLIAFFNQPASNYFGHGTFYLPFRMLVVQPSGDEVIDVSRPISFHSTVSDIVAQIQNAASTPTASSTASQP
jgi:hypothetical protein